MDHLVANLEKIDCHLLFIEYVFKKHPLNVEIISVPFQKQIFIKFVRAKRVFVVFEGEFL